MASRGCAIPLLCARMTGQPLKTRFAPSPTGLLHIGNVRTALFNWLWAHHDGGTFLLRIEDTDATRGHERYARALMDDLRWLGLQWDEGPERSGAHAPYAQSQRGALYEKYAARLVSAGLAYPCFCTEHELKLERKTQIAAGRPPRYSGKCRALSPNEIDERRARGLPATLRFHVVDGRAVEFTDRVRGPQRFDTGDIGDFVIRRSDGTPAFFFCNAVDDALMEVTLVIRGDDHLTNTPRQILLLEALGLPVPAYGHIPLVVGADGAPLSKRTGGRSLPELRDAGYLPAAINNYLARVGYSYDTPQLLSLDELAVRFDLNRVHHSPARYDETQLLHWQRESVRAAPADALWQWFGAETGALIPPPDRDLFVETVRPNVVFPPEALHWARIVYAKDLSWSHAAREVVENAGREFFERSLDAAEKLRMPDFAELAEQVRASTGATGKLLFQPLRGALTGELHGPEMAKLFPLIGIARARERFAAAARIEK
jgi:nondiscriminating glutamyl-tRNA synthetase